MSGGLRTAQPPPKPLMVYDGDCNFCTRWILRWRQITGEAVDYLPSQDPRVADQFPDIPRKHFEEAVQLIETDGAVYSGAEAVFRCLAKNPKRQWGLRAYQRSPAFARFTGWAYRLVADHRMFFSLLTRMSWGRHVEKPSLILTRWLFLRGLGLVYLAAFASLGSQIIGLVGHDGILPLPQWLPAAQQDFAARGIGAERFHLLPTLCWLDTSDAFLRFQCVAGAALAALLIADVAPALCLALLWMLYLSLVTVGLDFLSFQWDNLLLETGFLAIFFAPWRFSPRLSRDAPPSPAALWLLRLLLFKLVFLSGCVKWLSHDPNWRNLTALTYHYQTQPLPTWIGWYANLLPLWFQKFSCAVVFAIELGAPFLLLLPRRLRFFGASAIAFLQVLILLTGNYTFFNCLTLALCLLAFDDFVFQKMAPLKLRRLFFPGRQPPSSGGSIRCPRPVIVLLAVVVLSVSGYQIAATFGSRSRWLAPLAWVSDELAPFRTVNNYGLFAVMTTERREIIVEGSNDGVNWLPYQFKYKPGDLNRRPEFVAPFQPRLDWQMWFAALGNYQDNPWFGQFCERLLEGSPDVLGLLGADPFPRKPPKYIRAELYDYRFTNLAERRATGDWWQREYLGLYLAPISLQEQPGSAGLE